MGMVRAEVQGTEWVERKKGKLQSGCRTKNT